MIAEPASPRDDAAPRDGRNFLLVAGAHLALAIVFELALGLSPRAPEPFLQSRVDDMWSLMHHIREDLRLNELWRSVWHMHSQPPLFNLYTGAAAKMFPGNEAAQMEALHWFHIALGAMLSGCAYLILARTTSNRRFALIAGLALTLDPSLYLYEAFILYESPASALVVASVACLAMAATSESPRRERWLYLFIATLNVLILLRSLYHLIVLIPALLVAAVAARDHWRRVLVVGCLLSAVSLGWHVKNYAMFSVFGTSSWGGLSLWKTASFAPEAKERLPELVKEGVIDPAGLISDEFIARGGFCIRPSYYQQYGYAKTSEVPVLSRDDYHDLNIVDISKLHGRNAVQLIKREPLAYLKAVYTAYFYFCLPSSRHEYVDANAAKLAFLEVPFSQVLLGQAFCRRLEATPLGLIFGSSFLYFLFPMALLIYAGMILRQRGMSPRGWLEHLRDDPAMSFAFFLIPYTIAVSCFMEIGENDRMKILIEQLFYVFALVLAHRLVQARQKARGTV